MNRISIAVLGSVLLGACGQPEAPSAHGAGAAPAAASTTAAASTQGAHATATSPSSAGGGRALAQRPREVVNPDDTTIVLLYHDLAGVEVPVDAWVEQDRRLMSAAGADKAALREVIRQELQAGMAAVRDIGRIRLSLHNAQLSEYDPTYGEFTVRALSPSSMVSFSAFRQKVDVRFNNGREAQTWLVPADEARAISDRIGNYATVQLEALLQITGVQPGMGSGTLNVDILEYELRENRGGTTVGRVRLGGR